MLQNRHTHFTKSSRFKIYYQIQDHSLYDFESVSDLFGFLGIKGLRIFLKKIFMEYFVVFYYFNL